jgi:hypothetical protein
MNNLLSGWQNRQVGGDGSASLSDRPATTTLRLRLIALMWLGLVGAGLAILDIHGVTPGVQTGAPEKWQAESSIPLNTSGSTLLVFLHPYCPCSRATLTELARIMAQCGDQISAHVIFVMSDGEEPVWAENPLWQAAAAIPGVRAVADAHAVEATRFRAQTSGQTLLFDRQGNCLFAGGITPARGHEGDSVGRSVIISGVRSGQSESHWSPTFGCPLFAGGATAKETH